MADILKEEQPKLTISDVAEALGISKTTVSRAISGKGRIGAETREKVLDFIEKNNYKPSPLAKGLANSKTYNLCWAMPGDSTVTDLPFFQRTMLGMGDVASAADYDIIIAFIYNDDVAHLRKVVTERKVDGVVLGRTLIDDDCVRFLSESGIPFVVVGSTDEPNVIQIDNDHISACKELTSILIMKGLRRFSYICGSVTHVVNRTRLAGFDMAINDAGIEPEKVNKFLNCDEETDIERAVDASLKAGVECIICSDDRICISVLNKLKKDGVDVPGEVKIASFYNSSILDNYQPAVTALKYDPKELGAVACRTLLDMLNGEKVEEKVLLSYEVLLKSSTQ